MLLYHGYYVLGIDKKLNKWNENVNNITMIRNLNDKNCFNSLPKDISYVIHLAANAKVYNSVIDPSMAKENIDILYNTLEFCRKTNISNFLFASSREVYGNNLEEKTSEELLDISLCESPYSSSKIAGETLVNSYQKCYSINSIILRLSNVYGMYDDSNRIIPLFIKLAKQNKDLVIFGKSKSLDFTYIDDVVSIIIKLINNFPKKETTFNISKGESVFLIDLAKKIIKELNSSSKIVIKANRVGEISNYCGDILKANKLINFNPKISIDDGIIRSLEYYGSS